MSRTAKGIKIRDEGLDVADEVVLDFVGSGVEATDEGGGVGAVTVSSGGVTLVSADPAGQEGQLIVNTTTDEMKIYYNGTWQVLHTLIVTPYFLLLEDGSYLLLEDGFKLQLE